MSETEPHKARLLLAHARPYLPIAAAGLALFALWLAWSGWRQLQYDYSRAALTANRDAVVQSTQRTLAGELERIEERLASQSVQTALAAGDLSAASAALGRDWPHLEQAVVLPTDLADAYAELPKSGYGRIAAAEAALSENKPVLWIIRQGDGPRVVLAAPARTGERTVGVALVRLPIARATLGLDAVTVEDDTYIALRQGGFSLLERGDATHAEAAERMAVVVPGTGLRVAAALPVATVAPFGLDTMPAFIVAVLLLSSPICSGGCAKRIADPRVIDDGTAPTLSQALTEAPADAPERKVEVRDAPKPAPVRIDRGIFRAYDIRGVVGQTLDIGVAELIGHAIGSLMQEKGPQ